MGYLDNAGLSRFTAWVKSRLSGKQDKLTGTESQVVGFDAAGDAVPVPAPEGLTPYDYAVQGGFTGTEEEFLAQLNGGPYLPTKGGTVTGKIVTNVSENPFVESKEYSSPSGQSPIINVMSNVNKWYGTATAQIRFVTPGMNVEGSNDEPTTVRGIKDPEQNYDAANKGYVDSAIQTAVAGLAGAKIATGSYVGTGANGVTTEVNCGFPPKFLYLCGYDYPVVTDGTKTELYETLFYVTGKTEYRCRIGTSYVTGTITVTETGISLSQNSATCRFDKIGIRYDWVALG